MMNPPTSAREQSFSTHAITEPVRTEIKLFKLPRLVQLEILKLMHIRDTFTLSLCSSRMYNLIKVCNFGIARLCYKEHKNGFWVYNRSDENNNDYIVFVSVVQNYKHDSDETRVTYGGVSINFQWRPWGIEYIGKVIGPIQTMTQNHINGLFCLFDIDLELCSENIKLGFYPDLWGVTDILFNGDNIKSSTFREILYMHPSLKSLRSVNEVDGAVPAYSNLFTISEVFMHHCGSLTQAFLDSFSGSCAILQGAEFRETDVINVVTDWISGRKYHDLTVLHVMQDTGRQSLDVDMFLNPLRRLSKNISRPEVYERSFRFTGYAKNEVYRWSLWREEFLNFQRDTDQKMSTLVYRSFSFSLLVWN